MAIPMTSKITVASAITSTATTELHTIANFNAMQSGGSVILEIVGASTPSWTVAIQGKTNPNGTYTALDYQQIEQAGATALATVTLTVSDTTTRFYLVPNCPPFVQLVMTRTTGSLTVYAYTTSTPYSQWLTTTARGSIFAEGPIAHGVAIAGNGIRLAGRAQSDVITAVTAGQTVDLVADLQGRLYTKMVGGTAAQGDGASGTAVPVTDGASAGQADRPLAVLGYLYNGSSTDRPRGVVNTSAYINASAVSATQNGADRTNYNFKGLAILVDFTARSATGTLTFAVQLKDSNANYDTIWTAAAALAAVGQAKYLLYPTAQATLSWTEMVGTALAGRTYRVIATYGGTGTVTFMCDLIEMP